MNEDKKVYVVTIGYESFAFESLKQASAMMEAFENALYVGIEYCSGAYAVPYQSGKSLTLQPMLFVSKERMAEMKAEK